MTDGRERSKDGPWIRTVAESEATGLLAQHYGEARRRAGKIFNILRIQSLRPSLFVANIEVYKHVMFGPSGLTRAEREMAAVAVSVANHCHY